jgi:2-methylcitrate dehydratase PrpD
MSIQMSATPNQPTKTLAGFVANTGYPDLPAGVRERAKDCILDWIGSALAGKGSPTDRCMEPVVRELGGRGRAALVGAGASTTPAAAALYNGTISAVMEIDDVHELVSLHPGIGVIPAALAVAEEAGSPGRDLLAAVALGYDVAVRVARAAGESHYHFWHATGTCDTFGAAAAAGKLLHLDAERLLMALGLAGTQAAGLWESTTTSAVTAKHLHSGKAAFTGILSALLARHGMRGSATILEGEKGFLASSSKATARDLEGLTQDFGGPFLIQRNFFKKYACCKACIEGIDGIRHLMARHRLPPADIAKVAVALMPENFWLVGNAHPKDAYEAKFSLPFCIALAVVTGGASVHDFTDRMLQDPRIQEWMRKVEVRGDPDLVVRARIVAHRADGATFSVEPPLQSLTSAEVREKFLDVVRPMLSTRRICAILDCIGRLEQLEDIRDLTRLLRRRIAWPTR